MTTDAWGVDDAYYDALGTHRVTSPRTRAAIHAAMGVAADEPQAAPPVLVLRSGQPPDTAAHRPWHGQLWLEDGRRLEIDGSCRRICQLATTISMPAVQVPTAGRTMGRCG